MTVADNETEMRHIFFQYKYKTQSKKYEADEPRTA